MSRIIINKPINHNVPASGDGRRAASRDPAFPVSPGGVTESFRSRTWFHVTLASWSREGRAPDRRRL